MCCGWLVLGILCVFTNHCFGAHNISELEKQMRTECKSGYYRHVTDCLPCSFECLECLDDKECHRCSNHTLLLQDKRICVDHCPTGYVRRGIVNECIRCVENCDVCTSYHSCEKCRFGYRKKENRLTDKCESECGSGFSKGVQGQCRKCADICETCSNDEECETCKDYGFLVDRRDRRCVQFCEKGYYRKPFSKHCNRCDPACANCYQNNPAKCTECATITYLNIRVSKSEISMEMSCEMRHPLTNIPQPGEDFDLENEEVHKWFMGIIPKNCARLKGLEKTDKNTLEEKFALTKNIFVCKPPDVRDFTYGYLYKLFKTEENCKGTFPVGCTSCLKGFHMHDHRCLKNCPETMYPFVFDKASRCLPCPNGCTECHRHKNEIICSDQHNHEENHGSCSSKYYFRDRAGDCRPCHPYCVGGCNGSTPNDCKSCKHFKLEGACVYECPKGTKQLKNVCNPFEDDEILMERDIIHKFRTEYHSWITAMAVSVGVFVVFLVPLLWMFIWIRMKQKKVDVDDKKQMMYWRLERLYYSNLRRKEVVNLDVVNPESCNSESNRTAGAESEEGKTEQERRERRERRKRRKKRKRKRRKSKKRSKDKEKLLKQLHVMTTGNEVEEKTQESEKSNPKNGNSQENRVEETQIGDKSPGSTEHHKKTHSSIEVENTQE